MKWKSLEIFTPQELHFIDNVSADMKLCETRDTMGRRSQVLRIAMLPHRSIDLLGVIDTSDGSGEERVTVIFGEASSALVLLGGPIVYRIHSSGKTDELVRLNRDPVDEEFWATDLLEIPQGVVVIYEGGVFLITPMLEVAWHCDKLYTDLFDSHQGESLAFYSDSGGQWAVSVHSGRFVEPDKP